MLERGKRVLSKLIGNRVPAGQSVELARGTEWRVEGDYRTHYRMPEETPVQDAVKEALGLAGLWEEPYVLHYGPHELEIKPDMGTNDVIKLMGFQVKNIVFEKKP